jgi:3-oxoacyl-[acyl-carrier-protein] synthase-3
LKYGRIGPIAVHLAETVEDNDDLQREFPKWDMDLIYRKTGIRERRIAAPDECASDLGVAAAEKLFTAHGVDRDSIDFLLFCTQTPDYPLPTTACLVQQRLGLSTRIGALDFNLGCSGFVYGMSLADGLIRGGMAKRVLLITAETYSKYIHASDRSLRTIFSDAAAATLIDAADEPTFGPFEFGTDGSGGNTLLVDTGGARPVNQAIQPRTKKRWASRLYMDGPGLVGFTIDNIPPMIDQALARDNLTRDDIELFIVHQATRLMLELLQKSLDVGDDRLPILLENVGNTVSSTVPIAMQQLRESGRLKPDMRCMLVGFGVGLSWAGCPYTEAFVPDDYAVDKSTPDAAKHRGDNGTIGGVALANGAAHSSNGKSVSSSTPSDVTK